VANGVPGSLGCALVWAPGGLDGVNGCTALKQYDHGKEYNPPGSLFNEQDGRGLDASTLQGLIEQAGPSDIRARIVERLYQMNPKANSDAVNALFNKTVKWNDLSFIYASGDGFDVGYTNKPDFLGTLKPDGKEDTAGLGLWNNALFKHVDFPSSRWEAPPEAGAFSEDVATWIPSSGAQNLLGVLRLKNCTRGGGNWCSP
jgi:hypothetical protein